MLPRAVARGGTELGVEAQEGTHPSSPSSAQPHGQHRAEVRQEGRRAELRVHLPLPTSQLLPVFATVGPHDPDAFFVRGLSASDSQGPGQTRDCSPYPAVCRLGRPGAHRQHWGPVPVPGLSEARVGFSSLPRLVSMHTDYAG